MTNKNEYSQEERLFAALAHASIVMNMMGPLAGIFIYITQKEKSAYVARQALQATFYQLFGIIVMILAWACWGVFYAFSFIPLLTEPNRYNDAPPPIFWIGMATMICPLILMGLWGLYGLYGGLRAWLGDEFRYALIGRLVESRLEQNA